MPNLDIPQFLNEGMFRLILAVVLGSIIGLERELTHKSAGLRTHILVCMGSAVFTMLSITNLGASVPFLTSAVIKGVSEVHREQDISRICSSIVSGIGFIGGGAVLRYGTSIRGLTTAASLWMVASIGMLVGTGNYRMAMTATLLTFLVLFTVGRVGRNFLHKQLRDCSKLRIHVTVLQTQTQAFETWLTQHFEGAIVDGSSQTNDSEHYQLTYSLNVEGQTLHLPKLQREVTALPGVKQFSFTVLPGMSADE